MSENQTATAKEVKKRNFGPKEPVAVSESQILTWLEEGDDRPAIAKKLGVNLVQLNALFSSSDALKGKKTKKNPLSVFKFTKDVSSNGGENQSNAQAGSAAATSTVNDGTQVAEKSETASAGAWD